MNKYIRLLQYIIFSSSRFIFIKSKVTDIGMIMIMMKYALKCPYKHEPHTHYIYQPVQNIYKEKPHHLFRIKLEGQQFSTIGVKV